MLKSPEKLIAYFSKNDFDSTLKPGDQLIIRAIPQEIRNMGNPFEFDYRQMMLAKGIRYSVYLSGTNYAKTGKTIWRLNHKTEQIREHLISIIKQAIPEKKARSVISALTLGYRQELDPETIDYFTSTGAMHVLAVSGLHVGLIYYILGFLFGWLKQKKYGFLIYPVTIILLLWVYAALTGFSASVQRATVMFTFVIIGEILRRPVSIYNSLAASAFLLVLIKPSIIFEVGFQLSYSAVLGIVIIQPRLAAIFSIQNKFLKFIWDLFTVSLAAQLSTFPLGVYYFNQFPNFFWLSNFIVIPAATLLIWLAFIFFILSPLPLLANLAGKLLGATATLMIGLLKSISELPYALIEGIHISTIQLILIYGIIGSVLVYALTKYRNAFIIFLLLIIALQSTQIHTKYSTRNIRRIYIYNSENTLIHLINGRKNYVINYAAEPLSARETQLVQKVEENLYLDSPIFVNTLDNSEFESDDLIFSQGRIQFLHCSIFHPLAKKKQGWEPDLKTLVLNLRGTNSNQSETKTIFTGSSYLFEKQSHSELFSTGKSGAFAMDLR